MEVLVTNDPVHLPDDHDKENLQCTTQEGKYWAKLCIPYSFYMDEGEDARWFIHKRLKSIIEELKNKQPNEHLPPQPL